MYAPIVTRLDTYQIDVDAGTRTYMDAILNHRVFIAWREAALKEPWELPHYEQGETPVEIFRQAQA
jgi:glutathione S-transferase